MNIFQRFFSWILSKFKKPKQDIPEPKYCPICNKKLGSIGKYHCRYCDKDYCINHRLPEDHKCPNLPKKRI